MSFKRSRGLLTAMILGLALALLGVSVVKVWAVGEIELKLNVDEVTSGEVEGAKTDESVALESEVKSSYYLPYPGILPDHPLYFFKMIRDRVVEWLTLSPMSKAELYVFYADKRFGAGVALIEGNQVELGTGGYLKAIRYQGRAIEILEKLKGEGKDVGALANRIEQESTKFGEVIGNQEVKNEQFRNSAEKVKEELKKNRERVLKVLDRE